MKESLTPNEAYVAMFNFLDELSSIFGNDAELGGILGSMSYLEDQKPVDPTFWEIWLNSIKKAKNNDSDINLSLKR